jgi:hypothetical protein
MTGYYNTGIGGFSLSANTTGAENTAIGLDALCSNTTGNNNTANGTQALQNNTTGGDNVASGFESLTFNTNGSLNTAIGSYALFFNTDGWRNTAIGDEALDNNTSGSNNVALGFEAGQNITTGSSNIDIGNVGVANDNNIIRIGTTGTQTATHLVGNVGINEENPAGALHITGPANNPPSSQPSSDNGLVLGTTGITGFKWIQSFGGPLVLNPTSNNVGIDNTSPTHLLSVGAAAYCDGNTWSPSSDRNRKAGFQPVDAATVLAKVSALPITSWHYTNDVTTPHVGPMAQDFYAAFGIGADDKHISDVDEGGVALAAIQGLNQKLDGKDAEIQQLQQSVAELKKLVSVLARNSSK